MEPEGFGQYLRRKKCSMYIQQALKPEFRNWLPKISNLNIFGCSIFQGRQQYIQITMFSKHVFTY